MKPVLRAATGGFRSGFFVGERARRGRRAREGFVGVGQSEVGAEFRTGGRGGRETARGVGGVGWGGGGGGVGGVLGRGAVAVRGRVFDAETPRNGESAENGRP